MSLDNVSLPEFLTLEQAARVLGCRPEDIAALIRARRLPQLVRYGRRVIPGWSVLEVLGQMKAEAERLIADGGVGCEPSPAPTHPRASKDEPPGNGATLRPVPKLDDVTVGATAKAGVEDEPSPPAEPGPSPTQPACDGSVTAHVPALCRLEKCGNPLSPNGQTPSPPESAAPPPARPGSFSPTRISILKVIHELRTAAIFSPRTPAHWQKKASRTWDGAATQVSRPRDRQAGN